MKVQYEKVYEKSECGVGIMIKNEVDTDKRVNEEKAQ